MSGFPKLYRHFAALSGKEWKQFVAYVQSPTGTGHTETIALLRALVPHHPDFTIPDEQLFAASFPDRPYDNARLRVLRNYLLNALRDFLVQLELRHRPPIREDLLLLALQRKGLHKEAQAMARKRLQQIRARPVVDIERAEQAYFLEERYLDLQIQDPDQSQVDYAPILHTLDTYALAARMKFLCAAICAGRIPRTDLSEDEAALTLQLARELSLIEVPVVGMYYHLIHILHPNFPDADHLPQLQQLLRLHHADIVPPDIQNILGMLANKYIQDLRIGVPGSLERAFDCFKDLYDHGLMFGFGAFTLLSVRNTINLALRLKRYPWAQQFLQEARTKLPEEFQENIFHSGSAHLEFEKRNFIQAKKHLLQVDFYDVGYKISNDFLLFRIYFELGDEEPFYALQATLLRYIDRQNQLPALYKDSRKRFLRVCKMLYDFRHNPLSRHTGSEIRKKMAASEGLALREWLDEKLEETERDSLEFEAPIDRREDRQQGKASDL